MTEQALGDAIAFRGRELSVRRRYPAHIRLAECQRAWTLG
jgi:hypothetical protein